jgi:hypothetical protein
VIDVVARVGVELGYRLVLERLLYRDATGVFVQLIRDGRPALVLRHDAAGRTVRVIPERSYQPGKEGLYSGSYEQRPDVAIELEDDDGTTHVIIFDPKYKLDSEEVEGEIVDARPKKVDIDKMHAYRDAIRKDDERVVSYAAILYPGPAVASFGSGVEAIAAVPGAGGRLLSASTTCSKRSSGSSPPKHNLRHNPLRLEPGRCTTATGATGVGLRDACRRGGWHEGWLGRDRARGRQLLKG